MLAKYPFLERLSDAASMVVGSPAPVSLVTLLSDRDVVELGFERAVSALKGGLEGRTYASSEEAISSFVAGVLIASRAGPGVARRVFEGEWNRALKLLVDGREEPGVVARIVVAAGAKVEGALRLIPWKPRGKSVERLSLQWRVRVDWYLRLSSGIVDRLPILSLTEAFLEGGHVYLDITRLRALGAAAARRLLEERFREAEGISTGSVVDVYAERLKRLARGLLPYNPEAVPECIRRVSSKRLGEVSDLEAYTLMAFLTNVDVEEKEAEDLLKGPAGAAASVIAKLVAGGELERRNPPPCKKLREEGVCECKGSLIAEYKKRIGISG